MNVDLKSLTAPMIGKSGLCLITLLRVMAALPASAGAETEVPPLPIASPVVGELAPSQEKAWRLHLANNQLADVGISVQGMRVVATLDDPNAHRVRQVDISETDGSVRILWVAKSSGAHLVTIRSWVNGGVVGTYSIRVEPTRVATIQDRRRVAAQSVANRRELPAETRAIYEEALHEMRRKGDRRGQVKALQGIAQEYSRWGNARKALELLDEALSLARLEGDHLVEAETLSMTSMIYSIYSASGEPGYHKRELELRREILRLLDSLPVDIGDGRAGRWRMAHERLNALERLCAAEAIAGEYAAALGHCSQGLEIPKSELVCSGCSDSLSRGMRMQVIGSMAQAYEGLNDTTRALELRHQAVQEAGGSPDPIRAFRHGSALHHLAALQSRLGRHEDALRSYTSAKEAYGNDPWGHMTCETAKELMFLHRLSDAARSFEDAIAKMESNRVAGGREDLPLQGFERKCYEGYVDLLLHRGPPYGPGVVNAAWNLSERARSRALDWLLQIASKDYLKDNDRELLELEAKIRADIGASVSDTLRGQPGEPPVSQRRRRREDLAKDLEQVQHEIRARSPVAASHTDSAIPSLSAIQRLLDEKTLLLEFMLGPSRSYLWVLNRNSVDVLALPDRATIERDAKALHKCLSVSGAAGLECAGLITTLGTLLLGPVRDLTRYSRVLVVPDGALHYIPFGLLPASRANNVPLIAAHDVVSLAGGAAAVRLRSRAEGARTRGRSLAVFADPVFSASDPRVRRASLKDPIESNLTELEPLTRALSDVDLGHPSQLARLPFTRREAQAILSLARKDSAMRLVDFDATIDSALASDVSGYKILHFATHGIVDAVHPQLSGLVLSLVDKNGSPRSGLLKQGDIVGMRINADLVVLSACQTALGAEIEGEGLVGLTQSFMHAGAQTVVATLWRVDDAATAEFMRHFYTAMLSMNMPPAGALRFAQNELRRHPAWRSPYFWAGFIVQGEWR